MNDHSDDFNQKDNSSETRRPYSGEKPLSDSRLIRTIMDKSQDTVYFKDINSVFILNSKAHALQFGLDSPDELVGKSDRDFYPPEFIQSALADEEKIMQTGIPIIGRIERWEKETGDVVWFSASKYPLYDDNGNIVGTWGTSRNITDLIRIEEQLESVNTELARLNEKLQELSVIDELSGLLNKRNFTETLQKTMKTYARMRGHGLPASFSLVILDIDNFKHINDTYGHIVGDAGIVHIAHLLSSQMRSTDFAFRYGGDEFAFILPDTDHSHGKDLAERIRKIIEKTPFSWHDKTLFLTISLGVTAYTNQTDAIEMVEEADACLYQSKAKGKNQVT